jgi:uncharacterized membrane protein
VSDAARRLLPLDALRGLIMVLMALDHASAFIARRHSAEFWSGAITRYDSALPFLTRFVTHLCAPGFLFLMGCGMSLFAASRRAMGWTEGRIARFFVTRGLLLVLVNQLIENPAWMVGILTGKPPESPPMPGAGGMPMILTGVLTAIGLSAAVVGPFLRFGAGVWLALGLIGLGLSNLLVPAPDQAGVAFSPWLRLLLIPGQTGILVVIYPLLPWFAIAALGVAFGHGLRRNHALWIAWAPWIGFALLVVGVLLRAAGGFGNFVPPRDGSWIEVLNVVKYPPALVFTLWMIDLDLVLLGLLSGTRGWFQAWLAVYGQAPLFFYLAHLWLYAVIGALFFRQGTTLGSMYGVWLAGLIPLWFLSRWYRDFKSRTPSESVWRFF